MVVMFVGWSAALVSRQSVLFLREQTYDKVDTSLYSTKLVRMSVTHIVTWYFHYSVTWSVYQEHYPSYQLHICFASFTSDRVWYVPKKV